MRKLSSLGIINNPLSDEEIEGKKVNPTCKDTPFSKEKVSNSLFLIRFASYDGITAKVVNFSMSKTASPEFVIL